MEAICAAPAPTVTCDRCGRVLRSAASIARRLGGWCATRRRRALATAATAGAWSADKLAKVTELLNDGGLVRARRAGVWFAVASAGLTRYIVHAAGCTCPAGLKCRSCYHRAAVTVASV